MNGGPDVKEAMFALFKTVWKTERCPKSWDKTQIIQIFKSGSLEDINNYRCIHIKHEAAKMFGHLVLSNINDKLNDNMSEF